MKSDSLSRLENMTSLMNVFGIQIYCQIHHVKMSRHIYTALYGTCLAPFVTEIYYMLHLPVIVRFLAAILLGILIGFLLPPLSMHTTSMHMGYNLFNVGFSAGIQRRIDSLEKYFYEPKNEAIEDFYWELTGTGDPGESSHLLVMGMMIDKADVEIGKDQVILKLYKEL